ncbi:MAG TPA: DUF2007 domain-containing protein [Anaerolineae bacterium]|jgi:hypothetical protein|nr:DUF2007 domain-containing protein [Anaerolineae bacterium]
MEEEIVLLCRVESGPEAAIIISLLDGAGIKYMMVNPSPFPDFGLMTYDTSLGPIEFYVHRNDYDRARELLASMSS